VVGPNSADQGVGDWAGMPAHSMEGTLNIHIEEERVEVSVTDGTGKRITLIQEATDVCSYYGDVIPIKSKGLLYFRNTCQNNIKTLALSVLLYFRDGFLPPKNSCLFPSVMMLRDEAW
jgi:hypothetical protein